MKEYNKVYNAREDIQEKRRQYYIDNKERLREQRIKKNRIKDKIEKHRKSRELDDLLENPVKNGEKIIDIVSDSVKNGIKIKEKNNKKKNSIKGEQIMIEKKVVESSNAGTPVTSKEELTMISEKLWADYGKVTFKKNIILEDEKAIIAKLNDIHIKLKSME